MNRQAGHRAKNLWTGSSSGQGKATKTGTTVMELQKRLPKARIIYASATGASEPRHMAYMTRLGIWGPGKFFILPIKILKKFGKLFLDLIQNS